MNKVVGRMYLCVGENVFFQQQSHPGAGASSSSDFPHLVYANGLLHSLLLYSITVFF